MQLEMHAVSQDKYVTPLLYAYESLKQIVFAN